MLGLAGKKRVLLIGGDGVVLYAPVNKGVVRETSISWDLPNFEDQLAEALSNKHKTKPLLILFDGADQTYRKEDGIPKLSPFDRPRFIRRKLEMAFPSYPIRAAMEIKPSKEDKKNGKLPSFLFVALPETEQLDRISQALHESSVPIAGFGLLPAESPPLLEKLSEKVFAENVKKSRWTVLVGQNETGGLRQTVIRDGNLALTRLTPTSEGGVSGAAWADEVSREFAATLTYISRFGYSSEDGLDVIIICDNIEKQFFDQKRLGVENLKCISAREALHHLGIPSFGTEKSNYVDILYAAWLGRKTKLCLPIKVPSIQKIAIPRRIAQLGYFVFALSAIGLGALTAQSYFSYQSLTNQIALKNNQHMMLQREYEQESKVFDDLPVRPEVARGVLKVKETLDKNTMDVSAFLHQLKDALGNEFSLKSLNFEHTAGRALGKEEKGFRNALGLGANKEDLGKVTVTFSFSLPEAMLLEEKVKRTEELALKLDKDFPKYQVSVKSQFGKIEKDGKFSGGTGDGAAQGSALADFAEIVIEGDFQ